MCGACIRKPPAALVVRPRDSEQLREQDASRRLSMLRRSVEHFDMATGLEVSCPAPLKEHRLAFAVENTVRVQERPLGYEPHRDHVSSLDRRRGIPSQARRVLEGHPTMVARTARRRRALAPARPGRPVSGTGPTWPTRSRARPGRPSRDTRCTTAPRRAAGRQRALRRASILGSTRPYSSRTP
jgi:hypothetical protein